MTDLPYILGEVAAGLGVLGCCVIVALCIRHHFYLTAELKKLEDRFPDDFRKDRP
jgi:hypothetical protein